MSEPDVQPYPFDPNFELSVVTLLVVSQDFFKLFGHLVDPDAFPNTEAQLLVKACKTIAMETDGRGPGGFSPVTQQFATWCIDGSKSRDETGDAMEWLDQGLEIDHDPDVIGGQLARILRHREQAAAAEELLDVHARKGDATAVAQRLQDAERIGKRSKTHIVEGIAGSIALIRNAPAVVRVPIGIPEVDYKLGGGARRGEFLLLAADPGGGKSVMLIHAGCTAVLQSKNVLFISHELSEEEYNARILSFFSGIPLDIVVPYVKGHIPETPQLKAQMDRALVAMHDPRAGRFAFVYMPAGSTTVPDLLEVVAEVEQGWGAEVHVLVDDYPDKLVVPPGTKTNAVDPPAKFIYEGLRLWAEDKRRWVYGASQPKGNPNKKRGKFIDMHDLADSQHKIRIVDKMISINPTKGGTQFFSAKDRTGVARWHTAVLPTGFAQGRMVDLPMDPLEMLGTSLADYIQQIEAKHVMDAIDGDGQ